tara:strand:- start:151 stop:1029 length:879 start_codon:yes stop_codon:yes gene_type:complete
MIEERLNTYDKNHCWQYNIRVTNLDEDLKLCGLTKEYVDTLRVSDFEYKNITDKKEQQGLKQFIERHEWLGNLSQYTTHWFACYHKETISGVILFNMPNAFSKTLGENTKELERLISRGACISWSPKNLASSLLMWSIKWMVDNTQWRLFTAYSDPTAKELGTIYQACNFYYMGQNAGTTSRYINPYTKKVVSDRYFRQKTAYRKFAKELGIEWQKEWAHNTGMNWGNMPDGIEKQLRDYSKYKQSVSQKISMPSKHKYAYVLGRTKRETKQLKKIYEERNKQYPYPKERGN